MLAPHCNWSPDAEPASTGAVWSGGNGAGNDGDARPLRRGGYRGFLPPDLAAQLRASVVSGDGLAALSAPAPAPCACGCAGCASRSPSGLAVVLIVLTGLFLLRRNS